MNKLIIACVFGSILLSGCISYQYESKSADFAPTATAEICTDAGKLDKKQYTVLGVATASGNSAAYSRYELFEKLTCEAKKHGADVILVISHQVVPDAAGRSVGVNASFDQGDSNTSWQQIGRDMDTNYGNARNRGATESTGSYLRIVKAEFLKRNAASSPDKK